MNKFVQIIFTILLPFYPIWAFVFYYLTNRRLGHYISILWLSIVFYYLVSKSNNLPKYLVFLLLFTLYHLYSIYFFKLLPTDMTWFSFIRSDSNVQACASLFIIQNTRFEDRFIRKLNRNIFIVVIISLIVSLIQIRHSSFFVSPEVSDSNTGMLLLQENRIVSIYSWADLNSLGITFPILIAVLLNTKNSKRKLFELVVLIGIVVSFLTKARYIMISTLIIFSQYLFTSYLEFKKKVHFSIILISCFVLVLIAAKKMDYNIQQVINERILEKETEMSSAKTRLTSLYVFLIKFPEHPWLGVGPKTRDDVLQLLKGDSPLIHVGYLSYLYFYGLVGSLLLFLSIFYLFKEAWFIGKKYAFWASFYGLLSFCFANTTMVYFNFSEAGILIAILYIKYYSDESSLLKA
jgi:hypothetical protein